MTNWSESNELSHTSHQNHEIEFHDAVVFSDWDSIGIASHSLFDETTEMWYISFLLWHLCRFTSYRTQLFIGCELLSCKNKSQVDHVTRTEPEKNKTKKEKGTGLYFQEIDPCLWKRLLIIREVDSPVRIDNLHGNWLPSEIVCLSWY